MIQTAADWPVSWLVLITRFESIPEVAVRVALLLPLQLLRRNRYQSWRHAPRVSFPTTVIAVCHADTVLLDHTLRLVAASRMNLVAKLTVPDGTVHD